MSVATVLSIGIPVVMEILTFATEMRAIYGKDVTDEQIAQAWEAGATRYINASDAFRAAAAARAG